MSRRFLLTKGTTRGTVITLLDAQTADETTSDAIYVGSASEITFFVTYTGTITGGEVTVESATADDYSGTWANEGNSVGASNATDRITVSGIVEWIRVRINTAIAGGGTVTVKMAARGSFK